MLPYALRCGMTTEEFWKGEPRVFISYIKKYEHELDDMNYQSWLIGLYVHKAVRTVLDNAFSDKGSIKDTYFEKPLEELNSNYKYDKEEKQENKNKNYRNQVNYWSKFGKKGV